MTKASHRVLLWTGCAAIIVLLGIAAHVYYVLRYEADYRVMIRAIERALENARAAER